MVEIEKKGKQKPSNFFRSYSSRLTRILSTIRAGRARAWYGKCLRAGNVYEEADQELRISGNTGTIPK